MKFVKLSALLLAALLFSACTVYHQEAPKSSGPSGPEQQTSHKGM
ncbi:hypothetical protein [Candidatus Electronema sp. TJ]